MDDGIVRKVMLKLGAYGPTTNYTQKVQLYSSG